MSNWTLQDFDFGEISCQLIEFTIESHEYVMVFNRVDASRTEEIIHEKAVELGIEYRPDSYEVKFDLKDNFESEHFFERPSDSISVTGMRELGHTLGSIQ